MSEFDLTGLVVGGVSLAPIIYLAVEGLKRVGLLSTSQRVLIAVGLLATLGYGLSLVAQAVPDAAPLFAAVLKFGQALLSVLAPAGSAVLLHRAARAAGLPKRQATLAQIARRGNGQRAEKKP